MSHDCTHAQKHLVWSDIGSCGNCLPSRQLRFQCLDCGWLLGEQQSHREARSTTPNVDKPALQRCNEARQRSYEEHTRSYWEARERENAEWWSRYDSYLLSDKWRRKRGVILDRDMNVCQGCLAASATQVHHTTYSHVGDELAFQLVSLCDDCHERVHRKTKL